MNQLEIGKTYLLAAINGAYPRHSIDVIRQTTEGSFFCTVRYSADDTGQTNECTFYPNGVSVYFGEDCRVDWDKVNFPAEPVAVPGPCAAHAFCEEQMQTTPVAAFGETNMMPAVDEVNHPPHYTQGGIECIDAIRAALTPEEFRGYCKGNVLKYTWRERIKQQNIAMEKAQWYINQMLEASK
jgi:hypothetical protein